MLSQARPPPLVLMIYAGDAGDYAAFFAASGFRLAEAHSASDGVDQAVALRPDLIVLDFGYNGETVARLRDHATTTAIPIIALTELGNLDGHRN